jgi:hypothetical protein
MMKMLEMQVGQLAGRVMSNEGSLPRRPQGPKTMMAIQTHSGETTNHTKEKVITKELEFQMSS